MPKHRPYFSWLKCHDPNKEKESKIESPHILPYRKKRECLEKFHDYYLRIGRNNGFTSGYSFKTFLKKSVPLEHYVERVGTLPWNPIWRIEHYRLQILLDRTVICEDYDMDPELHWALNRKICDKCYSVKDVVPYFWYEEDRKNCHICGTALVHQRDYLD